MAVFHDKINIFRHLNLFRCWNVLLLGIGFLRQKRKATGKSKGFPFSLSIEPTTACNLGCPECPSGLKQFTRPTGKMDLYLHEKILKELKKTVFYINYYFQGEPFLHPQFLELIKAAKRSKIYSSTSTNAHFIDAKKAMEIVDSGLDRLIISIDGLTQETYEQYRVNGQLSKVLKGTEHLLEAKKAKNSHTPHLIFQFLAVAPNEHEIEEVFTLGKKMNIDEVRIKTAQLYDYEEGNKLMPKNEKYSRYRLDSYGKYRIKNKMLNECWRMWSSSVITWDGKIVPCCFDKDAHHVLGTLENSTFKSIWTSTTYAAFRKQVFTGRDQIEICRNCTEGTKVWA
jgi:radical SAM protein with 4Fe4S-binding SPASM domain